MDIIAIIDNIYQNINIYKSLIITRMDNISELINNLSDLDYPVIDYREINDNARVILLSDDTDLNNLGLLLSQISIIIYYNCGYPINNHTYYKDLGCINLTHIFTL